MCYIVLASQILDLTGALAVVPVQMLTAASVVLYDLPIMVQYDPVLRIVKSGVDFKHLSLLTLQITNNKVSSVSLERFDVVHKIPKNSEMSLLVDKYTKLNNDLHGVIQGHTEVMLDSREDSVRFESSGLLHMACDAVVTEFSAMGHVVDGAVLESKNCTGGSLCPIGPITMANLQVSAFKLADACTY